MDKIKTLSDGLVHNPDIFEWYWEMAESYCVMKRHRHSHLRLMRGILQAGRTSPNHSAITDHWCTCAPGSRVKFWDYIEL
jgi:hypothetical protein